MKERRAKEQSRRYESPYWVSNEGGNVVGKFQTGARLSNVFELNKRRTLQNYAQQYWNIRPARTEEIVPLVAQH